MSSPKIPFNDVTGQWKEIRDLVLPQIDQLGNRGDYIGGNAISDFETQFSEYVGSKYAVGISNGTDALKIGFQLFDLNSSDAVIIPANTFIADYLALKNCPIDQPSVFLIDHDDNYTIDVESLRLLLEEIRDEFRKIVVVPVHLYGHSCDMVGLQKLKDEFNLLIMEDCSQSHGTKYNGKHVGYLGEVSVYSLYPGKNLGALGDAGILTTNEENLYNRARSLRNYGSSVKYHYDELGHNHRLDTLQAIVLSEKLKLLDQWTAKKRAVAERYLSEIKNPKVVLPSIQDNCYHSYHIFCVSVDYRESFINHLESLGIPVIIHYPIPIHDTSIFQKQDLVYSAKKTNFHKSRIASIPIHPYLSEDQIDRIIEAINSWS